jgi:hypothetical protein
MEIVRVEPESRREVRRFLEFPFHLYRTSRLWVPPFVEEARVQLNPQKHPFYQHSGAAFFLAQEKGQVLGRVAVLENRRHNEHHGTPVAFFYLFDTVEDPAVSRALLDAACDWARGRGLEAMWGPKGFWALDGQGILVEGFEHRPALGVPYNLAYYGGLLEDAGFQKKFDLVSWYMDRQLEFPERFLEVAARVKERRGLRSVTFQTKAELRALAPRILQVYNEAFVEVQAYTPVSEAEAQALANRILSIADPRLISVLFKGEELAGFVIAYPDLSAAIQRCRGRMWPTGWYHLWREFKRTRWINVNGMAILGPLRGLGGNALMYAELYRTLIDHPQYDYADLVQTQESNFRINQEVAAIGLKPYKVHRVYQRSLR